MMVKWVCISTRIHVLVEDKSLPAGIHDFQSNNVYSTWPPMQLWPFAGYKWYYIFVNIFTIPFLTVKGQNSAIPTPMCFFWFLMFIEVSQNVDAFLIFPYVFRMFSPCFPQVSPWFSPASPCPTIGHSAAQRGGHSHEHRGLGPSAGRSLRGAPVTWRTWDFLFGNHLVVHPTDPKWVSSPQL